MLLFSIGFYERLGLARSTLILFIERQACCASKSKANREEQDGKSTQRIQITYSMPRISHTAYWPETIVHVSVNTYLNDEMIVHCGKKKKVNERMAIVRASAKKERDNRTKAKHVLHLIPMKETLVSLSTGKLCRFCCCFFSPLSSCSSAHYRAKEMAKRKPVKWLD